MDNVSVQQTGRAEDGGGCNFLPKSINMESVPWTMKAHPNQCNTPLSPLNTSAFRAALPQRERLVATLAATADGACADMHHWSNALNKRPSAGVCAAALGAALTVIR